MTSQPTHFEGKRPDEHLVQAQVRGILSSTEIHGTEAPGHLSAGSDAAKETALILSLIILLFIHLKLNLSQETLFLAVFVFGWFLWKIGRSSWLGWSRLERLHRVMIEEKWEIEHHREQERTELKALYAAKGFEGKLLDDVVDVLMADDDRLLKVMLEEELGLTLENEEHPLKQGLGAGVGTIVATFICVTGYYVAAIVGLIITSCFVMALSSALTAVSEKNQIISAWVWNVALYLGAIGTTYFLMHYL